MHVLKANEIFAGCSLVRDWDHEKERGGLFHVYSRHNLIYNGTAYRFILKPHIFRSFSTMLKIRHYPVKVFHNNTRLSTFPAPRANFPDFQIRLKNNSIYRTDFQTHPAFCALFHSYQLLCGIFKNRYGIFFSPAINGNVPG